MPHPAALPSALSMPPAHGLHPSRLPYPHTPTPAHTRRPLHCCACARLPGRVPAGKRAPPAALVLVQENISWAVGFAIPAACMAVAILTFVAGSPLYTHVPPTERCGRRRRRLRASQPCTGSPWPPPLHMGPSLCPLLGQIEPALPPACVQPSVARLQGGDGGMEGATRPCAGGER